MKHRPENLSDSPHPGSAEGADETPHAADRGGLEPNPVGTPPSPSPTDAPVAAALRNGELELIGQLRDASNAVFLARVGELPVIYKPVKGERPLWDFPHGTLAQREVAAYVISAAGGWNLVPPTVLRDGPLGPGSVQAWIGGLPNEHGLITDPPLSQELLGLVTHEVLTDPASPQHEWHVVMTGELRDGTDVAVAHSDDPRLRSLAVLDAVLNHSDRKATHILLDRGESGSARDHTPDSVTAGASVSPPSTTSGRVWAIDNGLCLSEEPKLRTVLWGWAGKLLPEAEQDRCRAVLSALDAEAFTGPRPDTAERDGTGPRTDGSTPDDLARDLAELLTPGEVRALQERLARLVETGTHPEPSEDWPALPWPPV